MAGLDIVFIAGIALFVAYRLYSVLGARTGQERPPEQRPEAPDASAKRLPGALDKAPVTAKDNVFPLPRPARANVDNVPTQGPVASGMALIMNADKNFSPAEFLDGAKSAHEMIVRAFAAGDRSMLQPLLAPDVYQSFEQAISSRETAGHKTEFTFVALRAAEFANATLQGRIAEVTVKFVSEMISATRDAAGVIVDGVAGTVREVTDIWTFARDTRSNDPNWQLVATGAA